MLKGTSVSVSEVSGECLGVYKTDYEGFTYLSRNTERMGDIYDWDGTITGHPHWTAVRDQPFYSSSQCEPRPHWGNMTVCPHRQLSLRVSLGNYHFPFSRFVNGRGTGDGFDKIDMTVTRNDVIDFPEINNIYKDPWHPKMSTDHSYIYSFHNNSLPPRYPS